MKHYKPFLAIIVLLIFSAVFAQTGTVKIFSEIKDINIYIDEELKGKDIKEIQNVQKGSHYLKIIKDSVAIYEQILVVEENAITTIVLKDVPEITNKLLINKKNEIAEYDSMALSFDTYLNFYCGKKLITLKDFAIITENRELESRINKRNSSASALANAGGITMLVGLLATGVTFSNIIFNIPPLPAGIVDALPIIGAVSIVTCIGGYGMTNIGSANMSKSESGLITAEDAQKAVDKYNSELKIKLGLPKDF